MIFYLRDLTKFQALPMITKKAVKIPLNSTVDSEKTPKSVKPRRYYEAVGRRKNAVARIRMSPIKTTETREGIFLINKKNLNDYFSSLELQSIISAPLKLMKMANKFDVTVHIRGGGIHAQAEAVRLGISRSLLEFNKTFRKKLKRAGFLERDARKKERKKPGLKKARRAPQWQKR